MSFHFPCSLAFCSACILSRKASLLLLISWGSSGAPLAAPLPPPRVCPGPSGIWGAEAGALEGLLGPWLAGAPVVVWGALDVEGPPAARVPGVGFLVLGQAACTGSTLPPPAAGAGEGLGEGAAAGAGLGAGPGAGVGAGVFGVVGLAWSMSMLMAMACLSCSS